MNKQKRLEADFLGERRVELKMAPIQSKTNQLVRTRSHLTVSVKKLCRWISKRGQLRKKRQERTVTRLEGNQSERKANQRSGR
jgi:hypothetical protein